MNLNVHAIKHVESIGHLLGRADGARYNPRESYWCQYHSIPHVVTLSHCAKAREGVINTFTALNPAGGGGGVGVGVHHYGRQKRSE